MSRIWTMSAALAFALALGVAPVLAAEPPNDPKDAAKKAGATDPAAEPPAATSDTTTTTTTTTATATATADDDQDDPDLDVNLAQPDFTLIGLPTTLRLAAGKSAFRITHRFGRSLGEGSLTDLVEDFFGMDNGAVIGFEYRFGILKATQVAIHRTNNKTIQFMLQREIKGQSDDFPLGISVFGTAEGTNNFKDSYSPGVGLLLSREVNARAAIYVEPFWVNNTAPEPKELVDDNNSVMVGLGARVLFGRGFYGVAEVTPRLQGYEVPNGKTQMGFGLEKRSGGHTFQLNVGNSFGTTFAQMARGGTEDWYFGFNISRKFY